MRRYQPSASQVVLESHCRGPGVTTQACTGDMFSPRINYIDIDFKISISLPQRPLPVDCNRISDKDYYTEYTGTSTSKWVRY